MGCHITILSVEERALRSRRLHLEHIHPRSCDPPLIESVCERDLIDERTSARVHQKCRLLHVLQALGVNQMMSLRRQGAVQTHHIALL